MAKKDDPDFETALARLEELIGEMESGKLNLDQMIARFEEGNKLVRLCGARLTEVEKKIEKLVKPDDPDATEPFETDEEAV